MKPTIAFAFLCTTVLSSLLLFTSCGEQTGEGAEATLPFGSLQPVEASAILVNPTFVALESTDESLVGSITQLEVYNNKLYLLDANNTNTLFVFSLEGKLITKLKGEGDGPGQFIAPHSFWISPDGSLFILDRMLDRLQRYDVETLAFRERITMPGPSPLSFAAIPDSELYLYYFPLRKNDLFSGKQYVVANSKGEVVNLHYTAPLSGKILHGTASNFYLRKGRLRTYPHFNNEVYELQGDSLTRQLTFTWGDLCLPGEELFARYSGSGDVMRELSQGDNNWIRLIYVYETDTQLAVKYYIKRDFYLALWDKTTNTYLNTKADNITDDQGLGGTFPLPIGTYGNQFIGRLQPYDINRAEVTNNELKEILSNLPEGAAGEEANPILVFYGK